MLQNSLSSPCCPIFNNIFYWSDKSNAARVWRGWTPGDVLWAHRRDFYHGHHRGEFRPLPTRRFAQKQAFLGKKAQRANVLVLHENRSVTRHGVNKILATLHTMHCVANKGSYILTLDADADEDKIRRDCRKVAFVDKTRGKGIVRYQYRIIDIIFEQGRSSAKVLQETSRDFWFCSFYESVETF